MASCNRRLQPVVNNGQDEITTVSLKRHGNNNQVAFQIDIKRRKEPPSDFLYLQLFNSRSYLLFHAFLYTSQCVCTCPDDVVKSCEATVIVYSVQTFRNNTRVWHRIVMGGKGSVQLKGGETTNYLMVTIQPLTTYLDLLADAPSKISYPVDVDSIGPRKYVLTNLKSICHQTEGLIVILHQIYPPDAWIIMLKQGLATKFEIPFDLNPATEYKLQLFNTVRSLNTREMYIGNSFSTVITFTTYMTQDEVRELYGKAFNFLSRFPHFSHISHFYRNKSVRYFQQIKSTGGVMHKYIKNWGGDQASTLNGQIQGLFFSANVDPVTHLPPDSSYFGSVRLHVPTYFLLNSNMNMYFSDFYCHTVNHKVQIVLAVKGSPSDHFCRQRLVLLNQYDNPFLVRVQYGYRETVKVTNNVIVEVFYTENVPIRDLVLNDNAFFSQTKQTGNALAMVNGIPKNRDCQICNLNCFLLAHNKQ